MTKGWKIATVAVVIGVVTYFGLEVLLPHHKPEVKLAGLVSADSVFSGKLQAPGDVAAAAEATPGSAGVDAAATTPSGPAVSTDDAMAASSGGSDTTQAALVDTTTADSDSTASVAAQAPASEVAAADAEPAAVAKPATKPKPASKPAAKPAAKKPATPAGKAAPWWASSGNADGLHVIYAGSAAFERAIVVMGNAPFASAASANQNIQVSDASGKRIAGNWKLGNNNKNMLVFPVNKAGKFQVAVGAGLSDAKSRKLGKALKGQVVVQ